ncbi:type II toxin-antitoxin system death-on-curing family toxin [Rhodococcus aetherivorans]
MIEYLSLETLISVNAAQGGSVHSMAGVEANAGRPQSGFGDHETFPDLWSKAAAYVHSIASTQYFTDGNKRTAWLAANMFLDANGYELPDIDTIVAEVFVRAVAQDVFRTDEDPDATIAKASEWLRRQYETQRRGVVTDHRFEYAYLARRRQSMAVLSQSPRTPASPLSAVLSFQYLSESI